MKTITEYRPLIFSRILSATPAREHDCRAIGSNLAAVSFYCTAGFWLFFDTGFAPWNWQFWIAFGPLFLAGELAVNEFCARTEPHRDAEQAL